MAKSWLSLEELLTFGYGAPLRFRECGRGEKCTEPAYREFSDPDFVSELRERRALGAERIVFWFSG